MGSVERSGGRQAALVGRDAARGGPARIARVLVDVDLPHLDHPFDYRVPERLAARARPGHLVRVTLAGRRRGGWILELAQESEHAGRLAELADVVSAVPVVTPGTFRLARYVAERNVATASQVLSQAVPARHAAEEQRVLGESAPAPAPVDPPEPEAWRAWAGGEALLAHLRRGESPRAVWTALPSSRDAQLVGLVRAVRSAGRDAIVVTPTGAQAARAAQVLEDGGAGAATLLTGEQPPARRYRAHLEALLGRAHLVVGTRSCVWAPLAALGLVVVWDDGDDRLTSPRAPRVSALDVAVARAHLEGVGLVAGAFARSTKAQALVASGWAASLAPPREVVRADTPRVAIQDRYDVEREGPSGASRLPLRAHRLIREALELGPVLAQVPQSGYVPVVACARCRTVARCSHCGGPLGVREDGGVACSWCGRGVEDWHCPACGASAVRAVQVGSERTGEELGRGFPGVPLTVSSSSTRVVHDVPTGRRLVVATPGAEPRAPGGYAAVLILDAHVTASRPELWAPEEALRRWMNALVLARPAAPALVVGGVPTALGQALVRWDPQDFAARQLDERRALRFFPAATVVALDGAPADVEDLASGLAAETMGTVPHRAEPGGAADQVRTLLRTDRAGAPALLAELRTRQQVRAAHRRPLVRISINPPELF